MHPFTGREKGRGGGVLGEADRRARYIMCKLQRNITNTQQQKIKLDNRENYFLYLYTKKKPSQ